MYSIKRQETTGLFIVVDENGRVLGQGELPQTAINRAIQNGMPPENREALLIEAQQVIATENNTQPPAAQTAAQATTDTASTSPIAAPPQVAQPTTGQVTTAPPVTEPTNASVPSTTDAGGGDSGTNPPVKTLEQMWVMSV